MNRFIKSIENYISKRRPFDFLILVSSLTLLKCLVLFLLIEVFLTPGHRIGYFPDSYLYEKIADNLISGHGYSLSASSPFEPTMYKEPMYPVLIVLIKSIFHNNINALIIMQMLLNPLIAVLIYFIGRCVFNEKIARLSSFFIALLPVYGELSFIFSPESIFIIFLSFSLLCLLKAVKSLKLSWFILSGLSLGLASLTRNAALPLFAIYPLAILIKTKRGYRKGMSLRLSVFILCFFIITLPWTMRNQRKLGLFSISTRGGEMFAHTAYWAANFTPDEWRAYGLYLLSGNLARKIYPQIIGKDMGSYEYSILMRETYVKGLLKKNKEGQVEKDFVIGAIKNIALHPLRYLLLNAVIYIQTFKYFESAALMLIQGPADFSWIMSLVRFFLFLTGFLYTLFALLGIFYSRRPFNNYYLILVTILFFHIALTAIGVIPGGLQRHILPVTVFYSFFAAISIDRLTCAYS